MASSLRYHRNQLQFNVGLPHSNENITQKFPRPAPVMFEKLGATPNTTFCHEPLPQPLQFSVVSEERLSQAILLARRDLKKQRQQLLYEDMNAKSKKVCVKKKQSKASHPETASRPVIKDTKIDVKPLSARSRLNRENQPPRSNLGLPRRSMSPPTRDVDQKQNPGNDDQLLHEIERLHQQLISCLKQIQTIADTAKKGKVQWIGQAPVGVGELSVAVEQSRRTQRAEEMGIRLTRVLYGLQHQTRAIQNDLQRTTLEHLRPIQKSRYLQRLASVHRGAVRAMHMLVTQLGDIDLTDVTELPHTYTELRLLIEQLAICCTQVELTAEVCIPQSVTNLIGQVQLMNDNVNQQLKESKHRSEHNQSKECIIRDVDHNAHTTPDRRSMLQQGLAALYNESNHLSTANGDLNAAKRKFSNAQVSIEPTEGPPLQLPSSMLHKQKAVPRKGMLLPSKLQNKHVRYERLPNNIAACRSNYTAPTVTSQLKAVEVTSMQTHPKPLTPRKSEKICSPRSTLSTDKLPKSPSSHKIQDIHAELIRDLLKEHESKPALYHQSAIDSEYIASRTEKAVRDALKPILKRNDSQMVANQQLLNAQDISQSEFENAQDTSQSEFENSSYMDDSELTLNSRSLNDTADLQNIMKRLEDMEKEHTSIQNRWHTIIYEDINKYNQYTKYYDVQSSEAPDHPAPIQITLTEDVDNVEPALWVHDPQNSHEINMLHQFDLQEADSGITFTKPSKSKYQSEELGLFQQGSKDSSVMPERPLKYVKPSSVRLCLMPNDVRGIRQEAKRLKKSAFKLESWKISTFEPWQLIEEFSDDIMNQCFDDVFQEFNDIQDDIIKNIYETELREADN